VNITSTQPNPHLHAIHVRDVMSTVPETFISSMSVGAAARELAAAGARSFPVVDGGRYRGIVTSRQVADVLENDDSAEQLTVREILEECATTTPEATLDAALDDVLDAGEADGIPVLGSAGELHGWLGTAAVLRALAGER
jgi:CBS domain-containing protein